MPLWGKTDALSSVPKYLNTDDKAKTFFVDTTEAAVANNRVTGLKTAGWNLFSSYTDANGNTRRKVEVLVPMKVSAASAGDAGVTGNTAIEDATVKDS